MVLLIRNVDTLASLCICAIRICYISSRRLQKIHFHLTKLFSNMLQAEPSVTTAGPKNTLAIYFRVNMIMPVPLIIHAWIPSRRLYRAHPMINLDVCCMLLRQAVTLIPFLVHRIMRTGKFPALFALSDFQQTLLALLLNNIPYKCSILIHYRNAPLT